MKSFQKARVCVIAVITAATLFACDGATTKEATAEDHAEPVDAVSNRVAIPSTVRSNLGISFVTVERRRIEQTLRVPGRFEYMPTARRDYRTMLPGRIELLVEQFERVDTGRLLYQIDSPAWREHQEKMTEAEAAIARLRTRLSSFGPLRAAHHAHEQGPLARTGQIVDRAFRGKKSQGPTCSGLAP